MHVLALEWASVPDASHRASVKAILLVPGRI
jgi:hypothetical protein